MGCCYGSRLFLLSKLKCFYILRNTVIDSSSRLVLKTLQSAWNTVYACHCLDSPQIIKAIFKNKAEIHEMSSAEESTNSF